MSTIRSVPAGSKVGAVPAEVDAAAGKAGGPRLVGPAGATLSE